MQASGWRGVACDSQALQAAPLHWRRATRSNPKIDHVSSNDSGHDQVLVSHKRSEERPGLEVS